VCVCGHYKKKTIILLLIYSLLLRLLTSSECYCLLFMISHVLFVVYHLIYMNTGQWTLQGKNNHIIINIFNILITINLVGIFIVYCLLFITYYL
jgi:hypothetical protein